MARLILIILTMISLPIRALAQPECDAILALSSIQAAIERVMAPGHRRVVTDMNLIRQTLLRIDADSINFALRGHSLGARSDDISRFLTVAQTASAAFAAGRQNQARNYLLSEHPKQITLSAGFMLRPYPCRTDAEPRSSGLRQIELSGIDPLNQAAFTRGQVLITFGLSLALIPMCTFIIKRQLKRLALKRRRKKRHYVELPARLVHSQTEKDIQNQRLLVRAEIVDISCEGVKLRHQSEPDPQITPKVTIWIEGKSHPASVVWTNSHYSGLKFQTRLSFQDLRKLVKSYPPKAQNIVGGLTNKPAINQP